MVDARITRQCVWDSWHNLASFSRAKVVSAAACDKVFTSSLPYGSGSAEVVSLDLRRSRKPMDDTQPTCVSSTIH
jgi:hypothetical protein